MNTFPMPGGVPVWHSNLEGQELSNLYGFIEELYVLVLLRNLSYPIGMRLYFSQQFVGVYFSEEFVYACDLGYTIIPLRGYLFEKKASPFGSFVSSLYGTRS